MMRYTLQVFIAAVGILTGAVCSMGDTYAAGKVKNAVPRVVDANNNFVGEVIGTGGETNARPSVVLNIPGFSFVVGVTPDKFVGNLDLLFSTADCTGQSYFNVSTSQSFYVFPTVAIVDGILYGPRANSTPVAATYQSHINPFHAPQCDSDGASPHPFSGYYADPISNLSTLFTPPYRFVYP
jgi:hypothetical protein